MRINLLIFFVLLACIGCNSFNNSPIYNEGIHPISDGEFPFSSNSNTSVAKVFKGNTFVGGGVFISDKGLLLTNYSHVLEHFSKANSPENLTFEDGFLATSMHEEEALTGLSLLIEIEQTDVTDLIQKNVTETSTNAEIYQFIQKEKKELIKKRINGDRNVFVEIQDLYSGNVHIMVVYQVIRDVRLVFAPPTPISSADILDDNEVYNAVTNRYAIIRAYQDQENVPLETKNYIPISNQKAENSSSITAFGFPNKTFRLESERAIHFYNNNLNPYALSGFRSYLKKESLISSTSVEYAIKSLPSRVTISQNIELFNGIQSAIESNKLLEVKDNEEQEFNTWTEENPDASKKYTDILYYINQAYDVAEQTGDILYAANYFTSFSLLDDLSGAFTSFSELDLTEKSSQEIQTIKKNTIAQQQNLLSNINIDAELLLLKEFLEIFATIPENKQPLSVFDLFDGVNESDRGKVSAAFVNNQKASSFLFNPNKASQALSSGDLYSDSLFTLLDELSFSLTMARSSYNLHFSYLYPAQRIFVQGKREQDKNLASDAENILSFNMGSIHSKKTKSNSPFFYTTNDFSGKAVGSALLNEKGELLGIGSDEIDTNIFGNYFFTEEHSYIKGIRSTHILKELASSAESMWIINEINLQNVNQ